MNSRYLKMPSTGKIWSLIQITRQEKNPVLKWKLKDAKLMNWFDFGFRLKLQQYWFKKLGQGFMIAYIPK